MIWCNFKVKQAKISQIKHFWGLKISIQNRNKIERFDYGYSKNALTFKKIVAF
jgi:hypothetical protein